MPADRRFAVKTRDGLDAARDQPALVVLCHGRMRLPAPAVAADVEPLLGSIRGYPGRGFQRTRAGIQGQRQAGLHQQAGDAPIADPGAVFELAFHAQVGRARDLVRDFMHRLVARVAGAERELRPLLDVEHER